MDRLFTILENTEKTMVLVDSNLRNLEKFTGPLSKNAEQRIARIDEAIGRLAGLMTHMEAFGKNLTNEQGSLGQLVTNPELYNQLNQAAKNINRLTRQAEPIVRNVNIFTDKIARHPGVIVRDAVKPGTGVK